MLGLPACCVTFLRNEFALSILTKSELVLSAVDIAGPFLRIAYMKLPIEAAFDLR